jgi:hypothetical protein
MNKDDLIKIIREVVKSEIKNLDPNIIREALTESLRKSGDVVNESSAVALTKNKREQRKYSTNPILNQVLNDTDGGIPVESAMPVAAPSILDTVQNIPENMLIENKEVAAVVNVLKRDFREVLRASQLKSQRR